MPKIKMEIRKFNMKRIKVIISGGGTGGHIFPAISIANEIKIRFPHSDILFVGALGKMEMERIPAAGYKIIGLPVIGFPRKVSFKVIPFLFKLIKSLYLANKIIRDFKPDVAVGVGGFASGPILKAAVRKGVPAILQEQNSYAGLTNKLLAAKVEKICVAYPDMEKYFPLDKIVLTGNPVRRSIIETNINKEEAFKFFALNGKNKVVLIIGGSLGARTINESVLANLEEISKSGIQFIWQTGSFYYSEMIDRLGNNPPANLITTEFISKMDYAYAVADVVITRAGAGTISELCLLKKACILVPSPNVAEDHQTKNANSLTKYEAAILVKDSEAQSLLFKETFELLNDPEKINKLSENIAKFGKPYAAKEIVNVILDVIEIIDA